MIKDQRRGGLFVVESKLCRRRVRVEYSRLVNSTFVPVAVLVDGLALFRRAKQEIMVERLNLSIASRSCSV